MAINPDIKKILSDLRDAEAKRLAMQKQEIEDSAEDRKDRVDKQVVNSLLKEFEKNTNLANIASGITNKRLDELFKGPVTKLVKSSSKNAQLQAAALTISKETQLSILAQATEKSEEKKRESSVIARTGRIMATLAGRFLDSTEIGQSIEKKGQERGTKTFAVIAAIGKREILDRGQFRSEVAQLGKNLGDRMSGMGDRLKLIKTNALKTLQFFTDPGQFLKITTAAFWKVLIRPIVFGAIPFLFRMIWKGFNKLFRGIVGGESVGRLEKLAEQRNKDFQNFVRLFRGDDPLKALEETEERREAGRKKKSQSKLTRAMESIALPFRKIAESKFGKIIKGLASGTIGGVVGARIAGRGGRLTAFAKGAAKFGTRIVLPLAALGFGVAAGFKEFKKTGDIQKAIGEGLVGAAGVLSFGLINKKELQDKIKKPFLGIVEGITGFLDGELSPKNFRSLGVGSVKLAAAPFDIAFKMGVNITSGVARFFGAKDFANKVDAAFKNFDLGDTLVGAVDSIVGVFTKLTVAHVSAEKFQASAVEIESEQIANLESIKTVEDTIKGLQESRAGSVLQIENLAGEERIKAVAQQEAITKNLIVAVNRLIELKAIQEATRNAGQQLQEKSDSLTSALIGQPVAKVGDQLSAQMVENETLKNVASSTINITPVVAPQAIVPPQRPTPLILGMTTRNNENTLQRNREKDQRAAVS